jgi:site-specific DNA-adenine methylase
MNYGLPYMGSKNFIAEWVLSKIPPRTNFYDLFCGGGAITHAALLAKKHRRFFMNDLNPFSELFFDAVNGKYHNEKRWVSRETFEREKTKDPYIAFVWSFGNNGDDYLYSKEVEPWKRALHYARVLGDDSLLKEIGVPCSSSIWIKKNHDFCKEKYISWYTKNVMKAEVEAADIRKNLSENIKKNTEYLQNYLLDGLKKSGKRPCDVDRYLGTNGMSGHYFGKSQWEFPTKEVYEKLQNFLYLPVPYLEIYGLQELMQSLESLESLESLQRLEFTNLDYREVKILPDSVIYCDIPYRGTTTYIVNGGGFDYEELYDWAQNQKELVIISEYQMPEGFTCIGKKSKRSILSATANNEVKECLFVPTKQLPLYNSLNNNLFNILIDYEKKQRTNANTTD